MTEILKPIHPGEFLLHDFLEPMNLTPHKLALLIGVDAPRIHKIIKGERSITADTALRLARFFGTTSTFWMNAQAGYDLQMEEAQYSRIINLIIPIQELQKNGLLKVYTSSI